MKDQDQAMEDLQKKFQQVFNTSLTKFYDMPLSAILGTLCFDIIKFDQWLADNDIEYDNKQCMYKNRTGYSMGMYIKAKFGEEAFQMIDYLNKRHFEKKFSYVPE